MVKLSDIELPMIFKNRLLFSHGVHNNWTIHAAEVEKSLEMTDWSDQKNRSLFLSHSERDAQKWMGRIDNPYTKNGELYGDLVIMDADLALKLGPGKAPLGVSAEIRWPKRFQDPTDFAYRSFTIVPNPEVPETQVNFSKEDIKDNEFTTARLQVHSKVDTTNFSKEEEVTEVIEESTAIKTERVENVEEAEADQDKSDLMSAERGFEKEMENNANKVIAEVKEEEVMETKVVEVEEVEDEAKAEFSALDAKIEALQVKVTELTESFAKFSEAAEVVVEEEVKEIVEEVKEDAIEEAAEIVEEVKAESNEEEVKEIVEEPKEEVTEEVVEVEEVEDEAKAEFSALTNKIDKLVDVMSKKEAAPMSTAEFGTNVNNNGSAVIDRLTKSLEN